MVSKSTKTIAIAIIAVVVVVSICVWQSVPARPEVERVMNSFIDALNTYDADAAWALMSPGLQSFYGSKANFNSSVVDSLRESFWHESGISVSDRSVETSDNSTTACFTVLLKVFYYEPQGRHYGLPTTGVSDVTYTFKLVRIGDQWQVDDWYPHA